MIESWRRGSTPTNIFTVDVDLTDAKVFITYSQNNSVIIEKTNEDIEIFNDHITVPLTQADTLKFATGDIQIQIRYIKENGIADASNIVTVAVTRILKDGLISYV